MTATVPTPMGPALPGTKQVVLGLDFEPEKRLGARHVIVSHVDIPFLPCGLLLWGVTNETFVNRIQVGNRIEGAANCVAIPGEFFSHGYTFEQITWMAEQNELDLNLLARQMLVMGEAHPGNTLTLEITGPCERACFWGRAYSTGRPFERAFVEEVVDDHGRVTAYCGRLDRLTLAGIDTVAEVTAPSSEDASQLLIGLTARLGRYV